MTELKPILDFTNLEEWLRTEASLEERELWLAQVTFNSIMATSRQYDREIAEIKELDKQFALHLLHHNSFMAKLVSIASYWQYDREGTEATLQQKIRNWLWPQ